MLRFQQELICDLLKHCCGIRELSDSRLGQSSCLGTIAAVVAFRAVIVPELPDRRKTRLAFRQQPRASIQTTAAYTYSLLHVVTYGELATAS